MKVYEFDVKMWANARIKAPSKEAAVAALQELLNSLDEQDIKGWNAVLEHKRVKFVHFSLASENSIEDEEVQ